MKTKFTLLVLVMALFFSTKAQQVPNAGFENWAVDYTPDNWITVDGLFGGAIGHTFKDTVDKVQGNASLKIVSDSIPGIPAAGVVFGLASLGTGSYVPGNNPSFYGIPFTYRPDTLFFSYKYTTPGADTAALQILLSKAGGIVLGGGINLDTTSLWTNVYIPLTSNYSSQNTPDTLILQFYSSSNHPVKGSTLHIDRIRFGYVQPSAVNNITEEIGVSVYPNPASNILNITSDKNIAGYTVEILDVTGKLVSKQILETSSASMSLSAVSNGTYVCKITDKQNNVVHENKFNIAK